MCCYYNIVVLPLCRCRELGLCLLIRWLDKKFAKRCLEFWGVVQCCYKITLAEILPLLIVKTTAKSLNNAATWRVSLKAFQLRMETPSAIALVHVCKCFQYIKQVIHNIFPGWTDLSTCKLSYFVKFSVLNQLLALLWQFITLDKCFYGFLTPLQILT